MNEFKEAKASFKGHQQSLNLIAKTRETQSQSPPTATEATTSPSTEGDEQVESFDTNSIDGPVEPSVFSRASRTWVVVVVFDTTTDPEIDADTIDVSEDSVDLTAFTVDVSTIS